MLKRGQAEPVPLPGREGAGQESCPRQPCPLLQHPAAPGCFRPRWGHPTGLSDTPKPPNPCRMPFWGASSSRNPGLQSPFLSIHCVWKNLLGHNGLHSPGHNSRVRSGCFVSTWGLESCFLLFPLEQKTSLRFHAMVRRCQRLQCCRDDQWFGTADGPFHLCSVLCPSMEDSSLQHLRATSTWAQPLFSLLPR